MILFSLLKMILISGGMYMFYCIQLRNTANHVFNRWYLLATVGLSFVAPFFSFRLFGLTVFNFNTIMPVSLPVMAADFLETDTADLLYSNQSRINLDTILWMIYLVGVVFQGFILVRMIWRFKKLKKQAETATILGRQVYIVDQPNGPFSFFQSIFWTRAISAETPAGRCILFHEIAHVRMKHAWDLFFLELCAVLAWFNPVLFRIKKELATIHEFQADQAVVQQENAHSYAATILEISLENKLLKLTHSFFTHPLKRRIMMLTQIKKNSSLGSRLMGIGVCITLFFSLTSLSIEKQPEIRNSSAGNPLRIVVDAGHGGIDAGAFGVDGTAEKNLSLAIVKKMDALCGEYGVQLVLTRSGDELPGSGQSIREALVKRSEISNQSGARLLVSVHINAGKEEANGITVLVPGKEKVSGVIKGSETAGNYMVAALREIYATRPALLQPKQNVWILNNSEIPALLLECGNLSNSEDLAFLKDAANQEKLARKILEASVAFARQEKQ
jgi:N-acetylmuramoyl-L-alanine amidase